MNNKTPSLTPDEWQSKWHGTTCPICFAGKLVAGEREQDVLYKGQPFRWRDVGAFCDTCDDGIVRGDSARDEAFRAFRDAVNASQANGGPAE